MNELPRRIEVRLGGRRAAVVGVGNRLRGDDGAGSRVAERVQGRTGGPVFDAETVPENYLGVLLDSGVEVVVFVDAADHGGKPGECCMAPVSDLAAGLPSTHAPSVALMAGLLEARGVECWLIGIQPADTTPGWDLSPAVERAVAAAAAALTRALCEEAPDA